MTAETTRNLNINHIADVAADQWVAPASVLERQQ
jgi:hypothetical protein